MSWSKEENDRFEQVLALIEENNPWRWQLVAQAVGGGKTADDAEQHFLELNGDLDNIDATERTNRRRELYRQLHQHGANANGTAAANSRNDRQRTTNDGGASSSNSRANNNRANRPQA